MPQNSRTFKPYRYSFKANQLWKSTCKQVGAASQTIPVQDCKTRWDYTLTMLESFIKQEKVIKVYSSTYDLLETPTIHLLTPIRMVTLSLSWGGLISLAYPKIKGLERKMKSQKE